ncbi:MAG: hypothetical protein MI810_15610 [Flavobacteriales bacterium]|nr:hypothetical protein [Flavobacteriales bacterium]
MNYTTFFFAGIILFMGTACKKNETIDPGNDPNFTIVANDDGKLKKFNRKVEVFGINIYASRKVEDSKLLHAANVMAQYLDNDEDGVVDNQLVVDAMIDRKAYLFMWKKKLDRLHDIPKGWEGQDLGNDETHPTFVSSGKTGAFDATLEEVFHLITHVGYANVYPEVFGESSGTSISDAMDIARGGNFDKIPDSYPADAWYTYDDGTCKYDCQVTEYHYWALTSILGAQENRLSEIEHEWRLNTKEKVESQDPAIYELLTNPEYKFPTVLPDGTYKH